MLQKYKLALSAILLLAVVAMPLGASAISLPDANLVAGLQCGDSDRAYTTTIDIGCVGKGNPIMDALFAVIRFLSFGVGLVLVASLAYAGVQYTMSRDDPKAVGEAKGRIQSTIGALLLFIFGFALLNYLIPAGVLK